jgi:hypothetical protein
VGDSGWVHTVNLFELGTWAKLIENNKNKYIMKDSNAWGPMTLSILAFNIATLDIMT